MLALLLRARESLPRSPVRSAERRYLCLQHLRTEPRGSSFVSAPRRAGGLSRGTASKAQGMAVSSSLGHRPAEEAASQPDRRFPVSSPSSSPRGHLHRPRGAPPARSGAPPAPRPAARPFARAPRPGRAAPSRTHPLALREVVAAERVVQVEAHHLAVGQGEMLLHRRAATATTTGGGGGGGRKGTGGASCGVGRCDRSTPAPSPPRLGSARLGSAQPGSARLGPAAFTCMGSGLGAVGPPGNPRQQGRVRKGGGGALVPEACLGARVLKTRFPPRLRGLGVNLGAPAGGGGSYSWSGVPAQVF